MEGFATAKLLWWDRNLKLRLKRYSILQRNTFNAFLGCDILIKKVSGVAMTTEKDSFISSSHSLHNSRLSITKTTISGPTGPQTIYHPHLPDPLYALPLQASARRNPDARIQNIHEKWWRNKVLLKAFKLPPIVVFSPYFHWTPINPGLIPQNYVHTWAIDISFSIPKSNDDNPIDTFFLGFTDIQLDWSGDKITIIDSSGKVLCIYNSLDDIGSKPFVCGFTEQDFRPTKRIYLPAYLANSSTY